MSHSKTKFNIAWLKKKDGNGHLLEWWCHEHKKDKFVAVCRICEKDISINNSGVHALLLHAGRKVHREKAMARYSNRESKLLKAKEMDEASTSASVGQGDTEKQSHEVTQEGTTQVSIQEFFVKKAKDTITSERVVETCGSKDTESAMTVQDQIMKAETLWALKTARENFSFRVSDGVPELFQKMFPDSTIAKHDNEQNQSKLHDKSWTWTLLSPADS